MPRAAPAARVACRRLLANAPGGATLALRAVGLRPLQPACASLTLMTLTTAATSASPAFAWTLCSALTSVMRGVDRSRPRVHPTPLLAPSPDAATRPGLRPRRRCLVRCRVLRRYRLGAPACGQRGQQCSERWHRPSDGLRAAWPRGTGSEEEKGRVPAAGAPSASPPLRQAAPSRLAGRRLRPQLFHAKAGSVRRAKGLSLLGRWVGTGNANGKGPPRRDAAPGHARRAGSRPHPSGPRRQPRHL